MFIFYRIGAPNSPATMTPQTAVTQEEEYTLRFLPMKAAADAYNLRLKEIDTSLSEHPSLYYETGRFMSAASAFAKDRQNPEAMAGMQLAMKVLSGIKSAIPSTMWSFV